MTVTFFRPSSFSGWANCARHGAEQLFRPEIEALGYRSRRLPRSIAATLGSATHRAAEVLLREKAETGELPGADVGTDACLDHLSEALKQGETAFDEISPNRGDVIRQGMRMSHQYRTQIAPRIQPLLVEHRYEADIGDDIVLSGQPDVVAVEPGQIDDLKTGARNPGNFNAQVGAYSLLARSAGLSVDQAAIDFIKRVPVSKPQPDSVRIIVPLAQAEQTAMNVIRHIVADLRVFREGDERLGLQPGDPAAFLANPSSNLCSAKYCPCWGVTGSHAFCSEWRKAE